MENTITLSHAKKLRFLRKSHELKQQDVADGLKIRQQKYSGLENGKEDFTDDIIEDIATFFKITPAEFEMPLETVFIANNRNNSGNANNNNNNNLDFVKTIINSKDEVIASQKETIAVLNKVISEKDAHIKYLEEK
jgi:transcriptional regulator with XRE-family HTH domain